MAGQGDGSVRWINATACWGLSSLVAGVEPGVLALIAALMPPSQPR